MASQKRFYQKARKNSFFDQLCELSDKQGQLDH